MHPSYVSFSVSRNKNSYFLNILFPFKGLHGIMNIRFSIFITLVHFLTMFTNTLFISLMAVYFLSYHSRLYDFCGHIE